MGKLKPLVLQIPSSEKPLPSCRQPAPLIVFQWFRKSNFQGWKCKESVPAYSEKDHCSDSHVKFLQKGFQHSSEKQELLLYLIIMKQELQWGDEFIDSAHHINTVEPLHTLEWGHILNNTMFIKQTAEFI